MGLRKESAVRHVSYEELDMMLRNLVEMIRGQGIIVKGIQPRNRDDLPAAAILADMLNVPFDMKGHMFSIYSEYDEDFCLFRKRYESEHYNKRTKIFAEDIHVEDDHSHTKVTMPWRK